MTWVSISYSLILANIPVGGYEHSLVLLQIPFAFLLDSRGMVRWRSLVNREEQLSHAWHTIRSLEQEYSISQEKNT